MDHNQQEQVALHRWAVIAEAAGDKLTARERGALVRQIAARAHPHPDGSSRRYSRGTIDRWLRAWRKGGAAALKPERAGGHWRGARPPGDNHHSGIEFHLVTTRWNVPLRPSAKVIERQPLIRLFPGIRHGPDPRLLSTSTKRSKGSTRQMVMR